MSCIFGLFYKNGKPVSDELDLMYSGMNHFPHERHAFVVHNDCGFGHMLTYNTPESVNENKPQWIEAADFLFTAEGRLDNRDELFESMAVSPAEREKMPDGDLLLKAYLHWGENCVDRLMGKWSFAVFHTDEHRLFIARDKWDYSDVAYYEDDTVFAFSTSEKGLFPLPFIRRELDELKIARLLIVWPGDYDKSYFKGIRHLLPSHTLCITRDKTELHRYWNYRNIPMRRGLSLEEYTENLFDNLEKAVKARLRSYKPVAATLSGGLDSSTVCVLAADCLSGQGLSLRTYSHVPQFVSAGTLPQNQFGDERPFINAIVKSSGNIDPVFLDSAAISPLEGIQQAIRLYGEPFHGSCNAYWMVDIFKTAAKENYGTVLMGEFGNATTSWAGIEDALPSSEILQRYGLSGLIKKKVLKPVLYGNTPFASIYKRAAAGKRPWKNRSFCTPAFEKSLHITADRMYKSGFDPAFMYYFSDHQKHASLILDSNVQRLFYGTAMGCETGLELRDPTGDPRVIENAFSIPNEMFFGEMNKWILRTMMKDKLPDIVRLNAKKGKQSSDVPARLYANRDEMDHVFTEMKTSGFNRMADVQKMAAEWEKLKENCDTYMPGNAANLLRHIAAFEMYKTIQ